MNLIKILITGSTGFVGRNLYDYLTSKKYDATGLTHNKVINSQNFVHGDVLVGSSLDKAMKDMDAVVHCAGLVGGNRPCKEYKVNSEGTKNVVAAAVRAKVKRVVYISSLAVVDEYIDHYNNDEKISYAKKYRNHYTASKIKAEKYTLTRKNELNVIILRPGWIWGSEDENIIELFKLIKTGSFAFIGSGNNLTYFTHISNIIQAIELALSAENVRSGEIFNINDGIKITIAEFVNLIASELKLPSVKRHIPKWIAYTMAFFLEHIKPGSNMTRQNVSIMSKNLHFNIAKAEKMLGYKPDNDYKKYIKNVIETNIL